MVTRLAAAAAGAGGSQAVADIVDLTAQVAGGPPLGVLPTSPTTSFYGGVPWDVNGDGRPDFSFYFSNFGSQALQGYGPLNTSRSFASVTRNRYAQFVAPRASSLQVQSSPVSSLFIKFLPDGYAVGPSANFGFSNGAFGHLNGTTFRASPGGVPTLVPASLYGVFPNGTTSGKVGFRFSGDGAAANLHYGWANLSFGPNNRITVNGWAYDNTPNQPIAVGAVPEPAAAALTMGALVAGAAGILRVRQTRRRKVQSGGK